MIGPVGDSAHVNDKRTYQNNVVVYRYERTMSDAKYLFVPKCIGGVADHVHLLLSLPTTISISKGIQLIKGGSSIWIHQSFPKLHNLSWQEGYGAFSVGIAQMPETIRYIEQQPEHHRTRTFQEEYLTILRKHAMRFGERYLWD
jgi:putative transposase